ncbi:MAG: DUF86 domain-containing protein [Bacteroidetes bacterium]|nr:DUF86 domain-containing protein [Bacteroidota bacterium]MBU1116991.1 DUF86 domain-containing protein [Bacteroidota bacterium]MBU1797327.1 DUF86 domain-containing protein [Bacteroidota bacterium]
MKNSLGDRVRLLHIQDAILEIVSYTNNISFEEFTSNSMILFASVKQLEIIGEATNNITEHFQKTYNEIEWRTIIGLRNLLVHEYFGIDEEIVWGIIQKDLPKLQEEVKQILAQL